MFCPECGQIAGPEPLDARFGPDSPGHRLIEALLIMWRSRGDRGRKPGSLWSSESQCSDQTLQGSVIEAPQEQEPGDSRVWRSVHAGGH